MLARQNRSLVRWYAGAAALCAMVALPGWIGCHTGPAAIPPVNVNIDHVVKQLMAEYDTDRNGGLSRSELAAFPPLAACLARCNRSHNNEITAEELTRRLERIFDARSGLLSANCMVRRNGRPFPDAEVRFVPLPVLRDVLPIGSGVTGSDGVAMITAAPEDLPSAAPKIPGLMPPGLYLVEVTHPSMQIPQKYNRQTVLGQEISSEVVYQPGLAVDLKL